MADHTYKYVIAGGGLAGSSAVEGIREVDGSGSILLISAERYLPYNRPPLSKGLWFGKKKVEDIFVHDADFYAEHGVDLELDAEVVGLDTLQHTVTDSQANVFPYERLLIATGGAPNRLDIEGAEIDGICYYRTLGDYNKIRSDANEAESVVIIGGGYIGSEMAAALSHIGIKVTMVFPESYICSRLFPQGLGEAIMEDYRSRGIEIITGDVPVFFGKERGNFITRTREGRELRSELIIVGIGIHPLTGFAESAGLKVDNGIAVNEYLQSSDPDIFAAGDIANFPYNALGENRRIEHWDHALNSGKQAGRNMAGANEVYDYMPYFFSDLFDFGYEAVGDVSTKLDVVEDWQEENQTGVIYYLRDGKVRGAMMCNVWDKVPAARELIRSGETMTPESLRGVIK